MMHANIPPTESGTYSNNVTVDQALYCKLIELKWLIPEYQCKLIPRLGGLHIATNFQKCIGQYMDGSGLSEIWLESGNLGPDPVELVLSVKAYNKAMHTHKLALQVLWRLLMPSLLAFVSEVDSEVH